MFVLTDGTKADRNLNPEMLLDRVDPMHRDMLQDMLENMNITDKEHWGKFYEQCFTGQTAVQFLLDNKYAVDTADAIYLGNYLIDKGVLSHVCGEHDLEDKDLFYRFVQRWKNAQF